MFEYGLLPLTLLPDLSNGFELKARIVGSLIGNGAQVDLLRQGEPLVELDSSLAQLAEIPTYLLRYVIENDLSNAATEGMKKNVEMM